jgi:hypothetical protein
MIEYMALLSYSFCTCIIDLNNSTNLYQGLFMQAPSPSFICTKLLALESRKHRRAICSQSRAREQNASE